MRLNESRRDSKGSVTRLITIVGMVGLILGLGGAWSRPAKAEIQNDLVGFSTNHVFESVDPGENVDVMNGNLTLTIPIGPRYKLTDSFTYGLTLYYNSKIWEHECPNGGDDHLNPCYGKLPPVKDYGLGFSLIPARVYHHENDKPHVFRIQLEDGSDHFFCDNYDPANNCSAYTMDSTHMFVSWTTLPNSTAHGWVAQTTDGRTIEFGHIVNADTKEALATRIGTTSKRAEAGSPAGVPFAWVDYTYDLINKYRIDSVHDSQDRTIRFIWSSGLTIRFPSFASSESSTPASTADVVLRFATLDDIHELSPGIEATIDGQRILTRIEFPGLNPESESYRFAYERDEYLTFGYLVQRIVPTGAVTDYYYNFFGTSVFRPYHSELRSKILTVSGQPYRWIWDRFGVGQTPYPPESNTSDPGKSFAGSNPYRVNVYDPFNNLTRYSFSWTQYVLNDNQWCNNAKECLNRWTDGLLQVVSTYAGPAPDSTRLIRRVEYDWESDLNSSGQHKLFQYRATGDGQSSLPVHSMAVNTRQMETRTITPANGDPGSPIVTVKSSQWYPGTAPENWAIVPKQKDEYLDGVLYRSTYTEVSPSGGDWSAHTYVQVKDGAGNVASRTDRKFVNGVLKCEVRRNGTIVSSNLDCNVDVPLGDIATINNYDFDTSGVPPTGALLSTTVKGGDASTTESRTITMSYLPYSIGGTATGNTGFLKTKNYGFLWNAVDRTVDFNTGLTISTNDIAGNTTSYSWDALGRLREIQPASDEEATSITYPSLHETRVVRSLSGNDYTENVYQYDDLGRLVTTKRRGLLGTYDIQHTEYDVAGRVTRKSEWASEGTSASALKWTTYDYTIYIDPELNGGTAYPDPLGRIHGVTTSDDPSPATPTTETSYDGDVTTVKVRDIRGWVNGADANITSTTVYTKDALGRLVSVDAPDGGADAAYLYDETDNLVEVRLTESSTSHVQVRHFDYDHLGRLRQAVNPENGSVRYTLYDARGNLLRYKDARQKDFTMTYDAADRLLTRKEGISGPSSCLVLTNSYDSAHGQLVQQVQTEVDMASGAATPVSTVQYGYGGANSSDDCPVVQAGYTGLSGRLSWQTWSIHPWNTVLRSDFCQDALGNTTLVSYPDFTGSQRTRTKLSTAYRNGYLWQLGDASRTIPYITNVSYAPGGIPRQISRPTSDDFIDLDVRSRPASIRLSGHAIAIPPSPGFAAMWTGSSASSSYLNFALEPPLEDPMGSGGGGGGGSEPTWAAWSTGAYAYDMAGNVSTIGGDQFHYDALGRLVHATIPIVQVNSLGFAYDAFGNMTGRTRAISISEPYLTQSYDVDWSTNRLTRQDQTGAASLDYAYDENGNMTAEGGRAFVFDKQNRLREVLHPELGRIGAYHYDGSGYRVRSEAEGIETFLIRDASGQVLSEFQRPLGSTDAPVWNRDYIYAFGKPLTMIRNQTPATPKRLRASGVTSTGLTLAWDPPDAIDILGYSLERVRRADASDPQSLEHKQYYDLPGTVTSWTDSFPASGPHTYLKYTLTAMDTATNLSVATRQLVVYPASTATVPAPAGVTATPGNRSVTVRWTPVTLTNNDLGGYVVERQGVRLNDELVTVSEFVDTNLTNGQSYSFSVRAVDTGGRLSAASSAIPNPVIPVDTVRPGRPIGVVAEPGRVANNIDVSWRRAADSDVAYYRVFRAASSGELGAQVELDVAASNTIENYNLIDTTATAGTTWYYRIRAFDASGVQPDSTDPVSARSRYYTSTPANLVSVSWTTPDNRGTIPNCDTIPLQCGDIYSEDDDLMRATLQWTGSSTHSNGYAVYRKAVGETHFSRLVDVPYHAGSTSYSYEDNTIEKNEYTYFVTAKYNSSGDETAGSTLPASGTDHVVYHGDWNAIGVRNVFEQDQRASFGTDNKESRSVLIEWSRAVEPELVGYNVYRKCNFDVCDRDFVGGRGDHFACEPNWVRVNDAPVAPDRRYFYDSGIGGLGGCFDYTVRPVGPNGVEGPVKKITQGHHSALQPSDWQSFSVYGSPSIPIDDPGSTPGVWDPSSHWTPVADYIATVNSKPRGTGSADGPPAASFTVSVSGHVKRGLFSGLAMPQQNTLFSVISWSWGTNQPPTDLRGYFVEVAGSPNGPWRKLNKLPIAWWEDHYTAQGTSVEVCGAYSNHPSCKAYRVIAVDEDGNESDPVNSPSNPLSTACPQTPEPPQHLSASEGAGGTPCNTHLEWDASPGATEYLVYRLIINVYHPAHFYQTGRVVVTAPATTYSFDETGTDGSSCSIPLDKCPYPAHTLDSDPPCKNGALDVFYVTARDASQGESIGGESPRSNMAFWKCGMPDAVGYAKLHNDDALADAIASIRAGATGETLACWNSDGLQSSTEDETERRPLEPTNSPSLVAAPLLHLGSAPDPSNPVWMLLDLHTDHLGTVRAITSASGRLVELHNYYPFGEEILPITSYSSHRFTGHERDQETGLDYMLARYYSASLARFLSTDPASRSIAARNPQSWNRYTYAMNSPVVLVDPDGEAARVFIDNQTTGTTRSSFNETNVAVRVQRKFDKAGADATVRVGKPGLSDKIGAALKGDTVHVVRIVDSAPATEPAKVQGAIAHTGGGLPTEVHTNNTPSNSAATPQNERDVAVSNAAAHEVGHDLGLSDNKNTSQDVMTTNVTPTSQTTPKDFNKQDATKLKQATK